MDRIARLEAGDASPSPLGEHRPRLGRRKHRDVVPVRRRVRQQPRRRRERSLRADPRDARMPFVGRPVHTLRLAREIALEHVVDRQLGDRRLPVHDDDRVRLRDARPLLGVERQDDRDRPERPVGQPHRLEDARVLSGIREAGERREPAVREQFEIAGEHRGQRDAEPAARPRRGRERALSAAATMKRGKLTHALVMTAMTWPCGCFQSLTRSARAPTDRHMPARTSKFK